MPNSKIPSLLNAYNLPVSILELRQLEGALAVKMRHMQNECVLLRGSHFLANGHSAHQNSVCSGVIPVAQRQVFRL